MLIRVVPAGNLSDRVLEVLCVQLEGFFSSKCRLLRKVALPPEARNRFRKQYNAEAVMQFVSTLPEVKFIDKDIPTLIITDEDMYYKNMNFCFGLEDPSSSTCVVSTARLRPEFYDEQPNDKKATERLIKEAIHEIGHSKGLYHCANPKCVMCFSPSVSDIDIKMRDFCDNCKLKMMTKGIEF